MFARPGVVRAPGPPNTLTPGTGSFGVLLWGLCCHNRKNCQCTARCGRLKEWKVAVGFLASIVNCATTFPYLANAWIAAMLQQPTQAHQVECVRPWPVLLRVLERVRVNREQVRLAVGRVAVFARKHGLEHAGTTLVAVRHNHATTSARRQFLGRNLHERERQVATAPFARLLVLT